jgi:hypothetical protein
MRRATSHLMLYMRKRCSVPGTKHVGIIAEVAMTKTEIQEIVAQAVKAAMSEAGRRAGSAEWPERRPATHDHHRCKENQTT